MELHKGLKAKLDNPKSWVGRAWVTISALVFLVIALLSFSFFIILFCAALIAALMYGLWLQPKLEQKKPRKVIEGEYTVIKEEELEAKLQEHRGQEKGTRSVI